MNGNRVSRWLKSSRLVSIAKCDVGICVPSSSQRSAIPRIANSSTVRG